MRKIVLIMLAILPIYSSANIAASPICPALTADNPADIDTLPCRLYSPKDGSGVSNISLKLNQSTNNFKLQNGNVNTDVFMSYYDNCATSNVKPQFTYKTINLSSNDSTSIAFTTNCTFDKAETMYPGKGNKYGVVTLNLLTVFTNADVEIG